MEQSRKVAFSPPDIREEDIQEVIKALRSGWITTGPVTKDLEHKLEAYTGAERAVALNSATAALELTLRALGIGPGDEVIVPAYTYTATASVVTHVDATIKMVDSLPDSIFMDPAGIEAAITERTKAIISVDLAGIIADYDTVFRLVEEKKALFHPTSPRQEALGRIAVIADAAHSLGARQGERRAGAIADFSCFSFHAVKNLTTAEGGALMWRKGLPFDTEELYHEFQLWSLHGQNKDALAKEKLGAWEYDIVMPGYKCNMPDTLAALGVSQLARYEAVLDRRHAIAARYHRELVEPLGLQDLAHTGAKHRSSAHLYLLRLPGYSVDERNALIQCMAEYGVATNVHYKPLSRMSAYQNLGFSIANYPHADALYQNEVTLPLNTVLTDEDVEYVIDTFRRVYRPIQNA